MARRRLSESEKVYFFCLLFPPLWLLIPVLIACDMAEYIKRKWRK